MDFIENIYPNPKPIHLRVGFVFSTIAFLLIYLTALDGAYASNESCTEDPKDSNLICFNGILKDPCVTGSGYGAMICSKHALDKADKELNELYKTVLIKIEPDSSERKPKSSFINAQRKWIDWRDAICLYEQESNSGLGTWQSAARYTCLTRMTEARSRAFRQYLECFEVSAKSCVLQHSISE